MVTGWRYYWRRYLGWIPFQPCVVCGRWYWGGFPRYRFFKGWLVQQWQASWMDYCSKACCDLDLEICEEMYG